MIPECLQPIDVIGMIVAGDHITKFLVGALSDVLQQRPSETGGTQRIEHRDAFGSDDISGVGGVAFIVLAGNAGIARAVPDRLARDLLDPQGDRQSRIRRSGLGDSRNERGYRQRGNDDETPHLRLPQ